MAQIITKQQVIDLINKKIAGQGSAVDVGGALPAILEGLAEMGISSDMSETEQMQARKDLGLYYEAQGPGVKTVKWTDEQEGPANLFKLSDDTPSKDDIVGIGGETPTMENYELVDIDGGYVITLLNIDHKFQIIFEETDGKTPGIYCTVSGKSSTLFYNGIVDVVSKIPEKFLPEQESGGLEYVTVTSELVAGEEVNLETTYGISSDDYNSLCDGKKAGLVVESAFGTSLCMLLNGYTFPNFPIYNGFSVIGGSANSVKVYTVIGPFNNATITVSSVAMGTVSRTLTITGLPNAGTTAAGAVSYLGFGYGTDFDISGITGLSYTDQSGNKYISPVKIEKPSNGNTKYSFDMAGNHYEIVFSVADVEATVTVTPLS